MKARKPAATAAALTLAIAASASAAAPLPAPLLAAVAASQSAKIDYAFDVDFSSAKAQIRAHYDPSAIPHVHMLQPSDAQLNKDQRAILNALQTQLEGVGWCAGERMGRIADVRLEREDADSAIYSFQPTRESSRGQGAQFADRLRGELTLSKSNPDITAIHIFTPAAFDPVPFVHIASLDVAVLCAVAPNGRRYAAQSVSQTTGSAFGQAINEHNVEHIANLSPPP
jgi:hypothetical protein